MKEECARCHVEMGQQPPYDVPEVSRLRLCRTCKEQTDPILGVEILDLGSVRITRTAPPVDSGDYRGIGRRVTPTLGLCVEDLAEASAEERSDEGEQLFS